VSEWQKQLKDGRENVEGDERSGRPKSHRTAQPTKLIMWKY
jgi:hypothetical protein